MNAMRAYADPGAASASEPARLAQLLSLSAPDDFDDVALARRVAGGLPVGAAAGLAGVLGKASFAAAMVPEPTLRRAGRAKKPLSREHSERLYEISRVVDMASRVFHGDIDRIRAFLTGPHPLLGGEAPFDMARSSSAGADAVLNLIRRAEAGFAV